MDIFTPKYEVEDSTMTTIVNEIEATRIDKYVTRRRIKHISEESSKPDHLTIQWRVTDIKSKLKLEKLEHISEEFTIPGYDFSIKMNLIKDGRVDNAVYIAIQFQPLKDITNQQPMDKRAFSKVTYSTKCDLYSKYDIVTFRPLLFSEELKYNEWSFHWLLFYTEMLTPSHLADDCIDINITFEPFCDKISQSIADEGILHWKLSNYKKFKQKATNHFRAVVESPYFYTGPRGYRMQAQLEINSSDELWMSIFFTKGEFDDELQKEFPHHISVTMINQQNPSTYQINTVDDTKPGVYDIEMANVKATEENGYVRENALNFDISVQLLDYYN